MPERLTVSPLEASVILINEVYNGARTGHHNPEVAKALHGSQWRRWYHPENNPYKPAEFLQDSQKSQLFIDTVAQALDSLRHNQRVVLGLRYGLEDGELRSREQIGQKFGVTEERIRQIETKSLLILRHPSRSNILKSLLPERP